MDFEASCLANSPWASSNSIPLYLPSTVHSCVVNGRCQPSPRKPSFAQSVRIVPGPFSATASHHMTQSERIKIGNARMRCVTNLSILSEREVDALRDERVRTVPTMPWM